MHRNAHARSFEAVELAGVCEQCGIALAAHVFEDRCDDALGIFQPLGFSRD